MQSSSVIRTSDGLTDLIGDIYGCALAPDRWLQVTRRISDGLRSIGGVIYAGSRRDVSKSHFAVVDNFAREHVEGYLNHYITIDPRGNFGLHRNISVLYDDMVMSEGDRKRNEFYDWHRSHGCWYSIGGVLSLDDDTYCNIGFQRTQRQGHVGTHEIALYRRLVPHIARAVQIGRRAGFVNLRSSAAEHALDQLPFGVALIDADGQILYLNSSAEAILADADGLTIRDHELTALKQSETALLHRLVAESIACPKTDFSKPGGATRVSRPSGLRPYLVYVSPLGKQEMELTFTSIRSSAVVFITDPERKVESHEAAFSRLYGLTASESQMAASMLRGDDVRKYAKQTGITLNTARWRLKQIFAKTGCHSQSELMRLLLAGPGMLNQ